jgi:hypothetical protein
MGSMRMYSGAVAAGWLLIGACSNNDVPEHKPTLGTGGMGEDGGGDTGGAGVDGTSTGEPEQPLCWPAYAPADPALFQCVGAGAGSLEWEQYAGAWSAASQPVAIEFPAEDPEAPNVQACCESASMPDDVNVGCLGDCARAACNLAVEKLRAKHQGGPPAGCAGACKHRFEQTLDTWASYIEAEYDDCLESVVTRRPFNLPNPPAASDMLPWGAGRSAVLTIECAVDGLSDPYATGQTCDASLNPPIDAAWQDWVCPVLDGEVVVSGAHGSETASVTGSVAFRRGVCASEPCWLELDHLALETIPSPASPKAGVLTEPARASLAYPAFGLVSDAGSTLAVGVLGLDVDLGADRPRFTMANSVPVRIELLDGLTISDAWFSWEQGGVTLAITTTSCHCASCA